MKKKLLLSLCIIGTATTLISFPGISYAADETTAAAEETLEESGEGSAEGESSEEGEEDDGEGGEGEESETEETTAEEPDNSYYVIVTNEEGAKLYQTPAPDSSLSINIPIPFNTVLHILKEETAEDGTVFGYTIYSDLKEGYLNLNDLSIIQVKTAKEFVEEKLDGNWGREFIKVDGSGTPVSFNSLSKEELEKAEESNAAAANRKSTQEKNQEEDPEGGNGPVIDVTMETDENGNYYPMQTDEDGNLVPYETDKDGNPVPWETDEEGNLLPLETDEEGNLIHPERETEPEAEPEKKSGGFSIVSFLIGFLSVIILEALIAAIMILLRRIKRKAAQKKAAAGGDGGSDDAEEGGKKKKGIKLPIPKLKLPKIKLPKIGGKKKKKGEDAEE